MYARLTLFTLGPGQREFAEGLADKLAPLFVTLKGFKSTTFMSDFDAGEYGALSVWETKEDADAAGEVLAPRLKEAVGDRLKGPPTIKVMEVYEPKPS